MSGHLVLLLLLLTWYFSQTYTTSIPKVIILLMPIPSRWWRIRTQGLSAAARPRSWWSTCDTRYPSLAVFTPTARGGEGRVEVTGPTSRFGTE
jgi:hypothetical protein